MSIGNGFAMSRSFSKSRAVRGSRADCSATRTSKQVPGAHFARVRTVGTIDGLALRSCGLQTFRLNFSFLRDLPWPCNGIIASTKRSSVRSLPKNSSNLPSRANCSLTMRSGAMVHPTGCRPEPSANFSRNGLPIPHRLRLRRKTPHPACRRQSTPERRLRPQHASRQPVNDPGQDGLPGQSRVVSRLGTHRPFRNCQRALLAICPWFSRRSDRRSP